VIADEKCGEALFFLQSTDDEAAELKVQVERKSYLLELSRKKEFLKVTGSIEQRKAEAELANPVRNAMDEYLQAMLEHEKVKARRITAALVVEVWRTSSANRRVGNI
jgi:hypothetical protein